MDSTLSDSDDSIFLFINGASKRRAARITHNKVKQLKASENECKTSPVTCNLNDKTPVHSCESNQCSEICNQPVKDSSDKGHEQDILVPLPETTRNELCQKANKCINRNAQKCDYSCPLCFKCFASEIAHISHVKQCAKKSKITSKQLLQILESHKEQLKKRIDLGHKSYEEPLPIIKHKKTQSSKKEKANFSEELALALALSKSLSDTNAHDEKKDGVQETSNGIMKAKPLERFGFTSTRPASTAGRKRTKRCEMGNVSLLERTEEERKNLIVEKAAVILLAEDNANDIIGEENLARGDSWSTSLAFKEHEVSRLWKVGENAGEHNWYVEDIKNLIRDEREGSDAVKEADESPVDRRNASCIEEEIAKLNLPGQFIFTDWKKLINSPKLSDVNFVTKDGETVHMHSLVVYARCPGALDLDLKRILSHYDSRTVLIFLQYLYCGTLNGTTRTDVKNLSALSQSIKWEELALVLNTLEKNLSPKILKDEKNKICPLTELPPSPAAEAVPDSEEKGKTLENSESLSPIDDDLSGESTDLECAPSDKDAGAAKETGNKGRCDEDEIIIISDETEASNEEPEVKHPGAAQEWQILEEKYNSKTDECSKSERFEAFDTCTGASQSDGDLFADVEFLCEISTEKSGSRDSTSADDCRRKSATAATPTACGITPAEGDEEVVENIPDSAAEDFEVPFFDPYEHFNGDFEMAHSPESGKEAANGEKGSVSRGDYSSSGVAGDRNPAEGSSEGAFAKELENLASIDDVPEAPEYFSTPLDKTPPPSAIRNEIHSVRTGKRRSNISVTCSKIGRGSVRSKRLKFSSKKRSRAMKTINVEECNAAAEVLTSSVLNEFNTCTLSNDEKAPSPDPRECDKPFVEITPAASSYEEYTDNVSPLPDYSAMGGSTIKKHLGKYGLKKSLGKNKAKKILKHIYEELHPILNTKNGKIVKYLPKDSSKCSGRNIGKVKGKSRKRKEEEGKSLAENSQCQTGKHKNTAKGTDIRDSDSDGNKGNPFQRDECDAGDATLSPSDRSTDHDSNQSEFEMEEPLTQNPFSSAIDVSAAVQHFIQNNPDIHRRILMYEPIWLEKLRKDLLHTYDKKYKLSDLIDYLDMECISFRYESQTRTNHKRNALKNKRGNKA